MQHRVQTQTNFEALTYLRSLYLSSNVSMWVCSDCGGAQGESVGASSDEGLPPDPGRGRGRPGDPDEPACARERGRAGEVPPSRSSGSVDLYPAEVEPGRLRSLPGVRNNH